MPTDARHYPDAGRETSARAGGLGPLSDRRGLTTMVAGARTFSLEETFLSAQILNPPPTRHALLAFLLALAGRPAHPHGGMGRSLRRRGRALRRRRARDDGIRAVARPGQ